MGNRPASAQPYELTRHLRLPIARDVFLPPLAVIPAEVQNFVT